MLDEGGLLRLKSVFALEGGPDDPIMGPEGAIGRVTVPVGALISGTLFMLTLLVSYLPTDILRHMTMDPVINNKMRRTAAPPNIK